MPRPTAAQLAYGSCTVIFSTLAMLLLSQTSSSLGIVLITLSALALGLLVAMTVPLPKQAPSAAAPVVREQVPAQRETASVSAAPGRRVREHAER
ncbi:MULTISPECIES: hypothetical protein [unclassified Streptomyces]|uniref:hypothetical protein n=1 Tax=unclassified Streptomyces TaxID=2593676 RepID=UPI0009C066CA|nr:MULTISPECIES: hypothetical protein [unclassified Streptomyces]NEB29511.1 hypothetical protein [Streptomyces sp. SID14446]OQQ16590.1 hypothetical protein B0675_04995 [Streptomyces sp. M41(2017)]